MLNKFETGLGSPSTLSVSITWGIKDLDRSKVRAWKAEDMGELIWDDEFTVSPLENQIALLEFCDFLTNLAQNPTKPPK